MHIEEKHNTRIWTIVAMKAHDIEPKNITRHNLLVRIARLYYLCSMTHQDIADREGLSRIKVTWLLKEAVDKQIVEFKIKDPVLNTLELEEVFKNTFKLKRAIITPTPQADGDIYDILGRFTADFLKRNLRDRLNIGIGWGRTLNGMLPYLNRSSKKSIKVISLTGGLAANTRQPNPYDVASAIAAKLGASPCYPIVPAIVENEAVKRLLLKEKKVKQILDLWERIDIALMSIGIISTETGLYYSFPDPKKEADSVKKLGAVGDLLAKPFNQKGKFLKPGFANRTIRIPFESLKRIPIVIGIAGGRMKVEAILGALHSGYLNTLITDEATAKKLMRIVQK